MTCERLITKFYLYIRCFANFKEGIMDKENKENTEDTEQICEEESAPVSLDLVDEEEPAPLQETAL